MRIFLIRHGESVGNVDNKVYAEMQDHNVPLTDWGKTQAEEAGLFLKKYFESTPGLEDKKLRIFFSPYKRATQTKDHIVKTLGNERVDIVREDFLLREQDFGIFSDIPDEKIQKRKFPDEFKKYATCRDKDGKFYARPPMGESRADVAMRTRIFKETIMRDVARGRENFLVVGHGVVNRAFEMDFLHKDVAWFEKEPNPGNCDIVLIEGNRDDGYTAMRIYQGKPHPQRPGKKPAP